MPTNVEIRGQDPWQRFLRRFVDAGERAGFTKSFSKGLLAAFLEMVDNAQVHSEAKDTALVGYRYNGGLFEFFVADLGVGVLQSLRTNPEFGSLIDDSEAILLRVQRRRLTLRHRKRSRPRVYHAAAEACRSWRRDEVAQRRCRCRGGRS